jgi:hypothetical protein
MGRLEWDGRKKKRKSKCSTTSEVAEVRCRELRYKAKVNSAAESEEDIFIRSTRWLEIGAATPPRDAKYAVELISIEQLWK